MRRIQRIIPTVAIVLTLAQTLACSRTLMPTPNLYLHNTTNPFDDVPEEMRVPYMDILYVTDRKPEGGTGANVQYGFGRSDSLAYGRCRVVFKDEISWDQLAADSVRKNRKNSLAMTVQEIEELGRFPETPGPYDINKHVDLPEYTKSVRQAVAEFHKTLSTRLARSPRKDVYVYIHGFANEFTDAAFVMAELWHFMGREGVPIMYTWPAGRGLSARGYNYDRESSEFTVFHLKQFLKAVAANEDVDNIHLLAHSRGTDVMVSALRELAIEARASGKSRESFKLGNVVLAAADLDFEVATQRMVAERPGYVCKHVTIYTSPKDKALSFADILFMGQMRVGQLTPEDLPLLLRKQLATSDSVDIIQAHVRAGATGHSYFHSSPAASSDLILLLGEGARAGAENGRPLKELIKNFWYLDDTYLNQAAIASSNEN